MDNNFSSKMPRSKNPKKDNLNQDNNSRSTSGAGKIDSSASSSTSGPEADAAMAFAKNKMGSGGGETRKRSKKADQSVQEPDGDKAKPHKSGARGWHQKLTKELTKKQKIIALVAAIIFIAASAVLASILISGPGKSFNFTHASAKPEPVYSPLTGRKVTRKQANSPVTGVMIENSLPARPQSGLSQAGVVYEAVAEAGITRFLALYQEHQPKNVGPIRSARPYFVRWDFGYDASYAHVGGSPEALQDIKTLQLKDLDQYHAASYYHRISSRSAPHNMYTSMAKLRKLEKSRGWNKPSNFTGFARKNDAPSKKLTARLIYMNPSNPSYAVKYAYDKKNNNYKRSMGGRAHIDTGTGKQITPDVVVALVIPYGQEADGYHSYYKNIGSGKAYVFQGGTITKCDWSKASSKSPLKLVDKTGHDIKLNRGQTWLTVLGATSQLSHKT